MVVDVVKAAAAEPTSAASTAAVAIWTACTALQLSAVQMIRRTLTRQRRPKWDPTAGAAQVRNQEPCRLSSPSWRSPWTGSLCLAGQLLLSDQGFSVTSLPTDADFFGKQR